MRFFGPNLKTSLFSVKFRLFFYPIFELGSANHQSLEIFSQAIFVKKFLGNLFNFGIGHI